MKTANLKLLWILFIASALLGACSSGHNGEKVPKGANRGNKILQVFHHKGVLDVKVGGPQQVLSIGRDSLAILWNPDSGWALAAKKLPHLPEKIAFDSKQNQWWIACNQGVFYGLDVNHLSIRKTVASILRGALQFYYDPLTNSFLGAGYQGVFRLNPQKNQVQMLPASSGKTVIAVQPNRPLLAMFRGKRIVIRDARTLRSIKAFDLPGYKASNAPDRHLTFVGAEGIAASYGENLWIGTWQTGKMRLLPKNHHAPITALVASPNGQWIATGSMDKSVKLWRWPQGDLQGSFYGHFLTVTALAFADSGKKLISASEDGSLIVWNLKTRLAERRLGSLQIAMRNPWKLKVNRVRYARSFKVGGEEYNVSDPKTKLLKINAEIINTGLADNLFFSSNLFLTAPDQTRFHCVGLENYVALAPKAYFKRRIAPGKSLKGNFIFIIEPPYRKYTITYETLKPIPLKNY